MSALRVTLPMDVLGVGTRVVRIHKIGNTEPFFGPEAGGAPTHRFHDPRGEFRVCFLGEDPSASFAETFLRDPPVRLLTARGETPAAFGRRCIPADCVASPSNIPDIAPHRAQTARWGPRSAVVAPLHRGPHGADCAPWGGTSGRLAALGATLDFHHGLLTRTELAQRALTTFRIRRDVRLVQLHGEGLAQVGYTADVTSSPPPYDAPQALSRMLWAHSDQPDGILYRCRHDNSLLAIALYHRAADALEVVETEGLLGDRARLLGWRDRYGFEIA
jgi:hypothetical protein